MSRQGTNRLHRLLRLIILLQSGRTLSAGDLVEELDVSRRTLFRDLNILKEAEIPYYHDSTAGYRIAQSFFLPPINLTVPETLGLLMLGKTAAAQRGRPMMGAALSAIHKLVTTVPEPIRQACGEVMANVSVDGGAQGIADTEARHYPLLQRCIDEARSCRMIYKSPVEAAPLECRLDPYALHFAGRAWYVLGKTDRHPQVRVFKLARLQALEPLASHFTRPRNFKPADKFGQAWQLIPEGKIWRIELEFSAMIGVNTAEVRWHPSQKHHLLPDGRCRMQFTVDGLGEIAWWLCGYADQVAILHPKELREKVRQMHQAAASNHQREISPHHLDGPPLTPSPSGRGPG